MSEEYITTEEVIKSIKHIDFKNMIISSLLCLAAIIPGILLYNKLPDPLPVHFDLHGNPNGFENLSWFTILKIPSGTFAVIIFLYLISGTTFKKGKGWAVNLIAYVLAAFSIALQSSTLLGAIKYKNISDIIIIIALSLVFIVLGNFIPKMPLNEGGRDALKSPDAGIWWKRLCGKVYVATGFLDLSCLFFIGSSVQYILLSIITIVGAVIPLFFFSLANKKFPAN